MDNSMLDELDVNWEQMAKTLNSHYNATFTPAAVKGMVRRSFDKTYSEAVLKSLREQFRALGLNEAQVEEATLRAIALPQAKVIETKAVQKAVDTLGDGPVTKSTRRSNGHKSGTNRDMYGRNREF
ncbi:MAG TPA: hypothetical protein VJA46_12150 [Acidimicrobiia bacterium]|nr:hypothetical protein [Acidimicrobiia bacterium]